MKKYTNFSQSLPLRNWMRQAAMCKKASAVENPEAVANNEQKKGSFPSIPAIRGP